jgi:hypothetical protein
MSMLEPDTPKPTKVAAFALACINLPVERARATAIIGDENWNKRMLLALAHGLQLSDKYYDEYLPLIPTMEGKPVEINHDSLALLAILDKSNLPRIAFYCYMLVHVVTSGLYDGNGRVFLRNFASSLMLSKDQIIAFEYCLWDALIEHQQKTAKIAADEKATGSKTNVMRFAQVGAVAVVSGEAMYYDNATPISSF